MANRRSKPKTRLKVIALGGLEEIGKNMTVLEYGNDIIIIDCGLAFPEDDMLGIDLVIPDITYLAKNVEKIRGIVLTHGHEDHIGALPYVLKQLKVPVFGTLLTLGLLENKLREHKMLDKTTLHTVVPGEKVKLGEMVVEFIHTNHSIADSVALAIQTPVGMVIHTGDFKVDYTPKLLLLWVKHAAYAKVANMDIPVMFNNIKIVVDGKELKTDKEPFIYEGTTYLPVRAVGEAVGKNVTWDAASKTVILGETEQKETEQTETEQKRTGTAGRNRFCR